jgi:hypothetical protein
MVLAAASLVSSNTIVPGGTGSSLPCSSGTIFCGVWLGFDKGFSMKIASAPLVAFALACTCASAEDNHGDNLFFGSAMMGAAAKICGDVPEARETAERWLELAAKEKGVSISELGRLVDEATEITVREAQKDLETFCESVKTSLPDARL